VNKIVRWLIASVILALAEACCGLAGLHAIARALRMALFLVAFILFYVVITYDKRHILSYSTMMIGISLNFIALAANGFMMPFATHISFAPDYMHVFMPISDMHLWFLCDVLIWNTSIGDWILWSGTILAFVTSLNIFRTSLRERP
jgi:uncharacterized membrane protein YtjA (UPF0391 family)